jgi:uncharacterized protein YfbU (UPF0304 family)
MQALTERFEMRLPQDTIRAIDDWGSKQSDEPSRAEAIRRLVELGLSNSGDSPMHFSKPEALQLHLLCEIVEGLKIKTDIDPKFLQAALVDGHYWGIEWEYGGLFPSRFDRPETVTEVVDILEMFDFLEEGYAKLARKDKERVKVNAKPFGDNPKFLGFDGNNEGQQHHIARFLVNKMDRFSRFKGRDLNSHYPSIEGYRSMLTAFAPMRKTLTGTSLSANQISELLNASRSAD